MIARSDTVKTLTARAVKTKCAIKTTAAATSAEQHTTGSTSTSGRPSRSAFFFHNFHNFRSDDGHTFPLSFEAFQQEKISIIGYGLQKYLNVT